jgi:outer membrane protein assembly factor BamD (BamD/ComL family)
MKSLLLVAFLLVSVAPGWALDPVRQQKIEKDQEHGLKYFPGVGWRYIRPGMKGELMEKSPREKLKIAQEAFEKKDYDLALFAAQLIVEERPDGDSAPHAHYLIARVLEEKKFDEDAFREYQRLLERFPAFEKSAEAAKRQMAIADRHLAGSWYRWRPQTPWLQFGGLFLPMRMRMDSTAKLYEQIVTNAPYADNGIEAQLKIGNAYEKSATGWLGNDDGYNQAIHAYERLADRYGRRRPEGNDAPSRGEDLVAQARFGIGRAYQRQVAGGEYDQSLAGKAIDAYEDLKVLHPNDDARVKQAQEEIDQMRLEQARGARVTAEFYERQQKWFAAQIYHSRVVELTRALSADKVLREAQAMSEAAGRRVNELNARRLEAAAAAHASALQAENKRNSALALRHYREVSLNLQALVIEKWAKDPVAAKQLEQIRDAANQKLADVESLAAKDRARGDQLQRIQLAREAFAAAEKAEKKRRNAEALGKYAEADSALRDLDLAGLAPSSKEARELEQIRKIASEKAAALNQPLQPLAPTPTEK